MLQACRCEGCGHGITRGNTFNFRASDGNCYIRRCLTDLNLEVEIIQYDIYVMLGFPC